MGEKLTSQDIIKLIKLFRSHPILWDVANTYYKKADLRIKAYEAIAKEMDMTVEFVRKNVKSLRGTYKCEIMKMALKTETNYSSSLPWFNEMSFLANFIYKTKSQEIVEKNALHSDNETIATSTLIGLNTINTGPEDECTTIAKPIRKEEKSLEYESDEGYFNILEPTIPIKEEIVDEGEIVDDYNEEFIDISADTAEASRSKVNNCPPVIHQEIKLESEILINEEVIDVDKEDECDKTQEVYGCLSPSIGRDIKQTIDFENETKKRPWDFDKKLLGSNKKIKKEPNELYGEENQIKNKPCDNLTNKSESQLSAGDVEEEDMPVEFEIEDCDDELIEIINNYTKTTTESFEPENLLIIKNEIKEESVEESQSDDDVLTVIEITSDDDNDDDDNNSEPFSKPVVNLKRTINEMQDNLPSTSQSAIPFSLPKSSLANKEEDLSKSTIKSKVEAFKYLHCIKKFFQSQNDEAAYKIVTKLMMTFMMCSDIYEEQTS